MLFPAPGASAPHRILVVNDSEEEIPPHAAMRMTGLDSDGVIKVDFATADSQTDVIFNGPASLLWDDEESQYAEATFPTLPLVVALHASDSEPAVGDSIGTETDGWYLRTGKTGFRVLGLVGEPITSGGDRQFAVVVPEVVASSGGPSDHQAGGGNWSPQGGGVTNTLASITLGPAGTYLVNLWANYRGGIGPTAPGVCPVTVAETTGTFSYNSVDSYQFLWGMTFVPQITFSFICQTTTDNATLTVSVVVGGTAMIGNTSEANWERVRIGD